MNKELKSGDIIQGVQLAPLGNYPAITTSGKKVDQLCDKQAYDQVAKVFNEAAREIQVDFDHKSEVSDDSVAAGWIVKVWSDDTRGLLGDIKVSGKGAKALNELDYRFASAAFELADDGRPQKLLSLALTNRPNMEDIEKVYNSKMEAGTETQVASLSTSEEQNMTLEIKQALGLPEDATDAVVLNGIQSLNGKLKEYMDKEKAAEAEAAVAELPETCREDFKKLYADNPEAAKTVINSVLNVLKEKAEAKEAKPEVEQPETVCNSKEAEKPALDSKAAWAAYNSLPQAQKLAFAKEHKAELTA
jgi:phage I-like protein